MLAMVILNTVLLIVLFAICTILFFMLLSAHKHIYRIENERDDHKRRADYHQNELRRRAGVDENSIGYTLKELK